MWLRRPSSKTTPLSRAPSRPKEVPKPCRVSRGSFQLAIANSIPAPSDDKPVAPNIGASGELFKENRPNGPQLPLTVAAGFCGHFRAAVARGAQAIAHQPGQCLVPVEHVEPLLGGPAGACH